MMLDRRARRQGDAHRQSGAADGAGGRRDALRGARRRRHVPPARLRRQPGRARHGRCRAAPRSKRSTPELRARLAIVQQARGEDETRVRDAYARLGVEGRGRAVLLRSAGAHRGGASGRLALRRLDGRRACRHRPAGDPGAAAACARPGPARQCGRAGERRRRHRAEAGRFHAGAARRRDRGACGRSRASLPPWRPARSRPACSMPRSGSPIWCCAWRMW